MAVFSNYNSHNLKKSIPINSVLKTVRVSLFFHKVNAVGRVPVNKIMVRIASGLEYRMFQPLIGCLASKT